MIWVGRKILEFCCDFLILIPDFTDYDYLQQIETNTLDAINEYMSSSNKEIFKRNRTIKATINQMETIKSHSQKSDRLLFDKCQRLPQIQAEENQKAIEKLNKRQISLNMKLKKLKISKKNYRKYLTSYKNKLQKRKKSFQRSFN